MAATANKYSKNTLNDKDSGTTKQVFALMPLALQEYQSDATFESTFFCHAVWHKTDTEGKECVIGLLREPLSQADRPLYNQMHADKRKGKLRITKNGVNYTVLNDGGLNTRPYVNLVSIDLCAVNMLVFTLDYKNAYWLNTNSATAVLSVTGSTRTVALADLPKASKAEGTMSFILTDAMLDLNAQENDTLSLKIRVKNDEDPLSSDVGFESNTLTATVQKAIELTTVYKITAQDTPSPMEGTQYKVLFNEAMWERGDTTQGIWKMQNLFDELTSSTTISRDRNTITYITGVLGSAVPSDFLTRRLPEGMYYGFPSSTPFVSQDPPAYDKIVWVKDDASGNGMVHKVGKWTYNPPYVPDPLVITSLSAAWGSNSYAESHNQGEYYRVHIYPSLGYTVTNAGTAVMTAELWLIPNGEEENAVRVWPSSGTRQISLSPLAAGTYAVETVDQSETESDGSGEGIPSHKVGVIDMTLTSQGMTTYSYRLKVSAVSNAGTAQETTVTAQSTILALEDLLGN